MSQNKHPLQAFEISLDRSRSKNDEMKISTKILNTRDTPQTSVATIQNRVQLYLAALEAINRNIKTDTVFRAVTPSEKYKGVNGRTTCDSLDLAFKLDVDKKLNPTIREILKRKADTHGLMIDTFDSHNYILKKQHTVIQLEEIYEQDRISGNQLTKDMSEVFGKIDLYS